MSKEYGSRSERRANEANQSLQGEENSQEDSNQQQVEEGLEPGLETAEYDSIESTETSESNETTESNETLESNEFDRDEADFPKRLSRVEQAEVVEKFKGNSFPSYFFLGAVGILVSLTFYSFPFINNYATPLQSQYLYSGFAMNHGLVPYNDFFGNAGSLFYLINQLGNITGNSLILYLIQLVALIASGMIMYRLVIQQTMNASAATVVGSFAMITAAGLARGGASPTLLALPFVLWAVKFLDRYFRDDNRDEKFIVFGIFAAIVFVISPIMSAFFLVSFIALLIYNISHLHLGRGFYQLLAAAFGLLLVGYSIAYYALNEQTIYTSIEQSVLIPLTHYGMTGNGLLTVAKASVFLLIFGIVTSFFHGLIQIKEASSATIWYILLLIGVVFVSLMVIVVPNFDSSNLLAAFPFIMVFQGPSLARAIDGKNNMLLTYLQNKLFAPLLAIVFVFGAPFAYAYMNHTTFTAEKAVVQYVKENTTSKDHVYVLAADKNINLLSKRTATIDNVPEYYPNKFKQSYDVNVANIKDKLIIVEAGQSVPESLAKTIKASYQPIGTGNGQFTIYEKK